MPPCRTSKLACDHSQPVCTRCRNANRSDRCKYRESPFKKRRKQGTGAPSPNNTERPSTQASKPDIHIEGIITKPHKYPNPGYLGTFSYATLFDHLSGADSRPPTRETIGSNQDKDVRPENILSQNNIAYSAKLIKQIHRLLPPSSCYITIQSWKAKKINLALASALVEPCATTVKLLLSETAQDPQDAVITAQNLFANSCRPLVASHNDTIEDYCAQLSHQIARWETLGLFCTAVSRAATDLTYTECSCKSDQERIDMQRLAMHFSDVCLEMAVSLDCLNGLQLLLQYENFILHSMVDGDQSYHSWKRLGDMTSSLFARTDRDESPVPGGVTLMGQSYRMNC